jgi:hypothetical protein
MLHVHVLDLAYLLMLLQLVILWHFRLQGVMLHESGFLLLFVGMLQVSHGMSMGVGVSPWCSGQVHTTTGDDAACLLMPLQGGRRWQALSQQASLQE